MNKPSYIYFLTNKTNKVLYIGVTSNLVKRIYEHKQKFVEGFSKKYNLTKLVYFEQADTITVAIEREKQLKGWLRSKKDSLVNTKNPEWRDLYDEID